MSDAREFTADLLAGRRSHISDEVARSPGASGTPEQIVQRTRDSLDALESLRRTDPQDAVVEFRGLLSNPTLTEVDLDQFLEVWRTAVDDPETFQKNLEPPPPADERDRGPRNWWEALRGFLHRPAEPDDTQREVLANLAKIYRFPSSEAAPEVNPHERLFEELDPAWVPLAAAKIGERRWPKGLMAMPRHTAEDPFVYDAIGPDGKPLAAGVAHQIALFSDFGTGSYYSWGIAEQIAAWALPYAFHLGDVYYGGSANEFEHRFERPLAAVVKKSRLLGLAENHELYDGGGQYLAYFEKLRKAGRTHQRASYFCMRFPHHQVIAVDCNWQGRRRCTDAELLAWLGERLDEAGGRTNILLTGNSPYEHGHSGPRKLLDDLSRFVSTGQIALWFWGDDHYCALFDKKPELPFYGSCIGHAGYPGARITKWQETYKTSPLWVEDLARFPAWTQLRQDVTNPGWCHATLRADGGVDLLYVDWLWCKRVRASFDRSGPGVALAGQITMFDRDNAPERHEPR
jgi:hypothetical protein